MINFRRSTRITATGLLIVLLGLYYTEVAFAPPFAWYGILSLSALGFACALSSPGLGAGYFGVLLGTIPFFGNSGVGFGCAAWLLGSELAMFSEPERPLRRAQFLMDLGILLFLLSLFTAMLRSVLFEADALLISNLYESGGIRGLAHFALDNPRVWNTYLLNLSGAVLASLVMRYFAQHPGHTKRVLWGLAIGALMSSLVLFLQRADVHPWLAFNRSAFWVFVGRYPGLWSDPNAFGVMGALLLPLLLTTGVKYEKFFFRGAAGILVLAAAWSGSRTFWLGAALWLLFLGVKTLLKKHRTHGFILLLGTVAVLMVVAVPSVNRSMREVIPTPGLQRLLQSVDFEEGPEMWKSRLIFSRIAVQVWRESPVLGVGLGRFYGLQSQAAKAIGIDLGEWRDNANNYYLQVLAESGAYGLLLVLSSFLLFWRAVSTRDRSAPASSSHFRQILAVTLLLLLTGPHLLYDEVKFLLAFILGTAVAERDGVSGNELREARAWVYGLACLGALMIPLIFVQSGEKPLRRGLYAKEFSEGEFFVWTGKQSFFAVCPAGAKTLTLEYRSLHPDLDSRPLNISFSLEDGEGRSEAKPLRLSTTDWQKVVLHPEGSTEGSKWWVRIQVSRTWSPAEHGGGDRRQLGLMLRWPNLLCGQ